MPAITARDKRETTERDYYLSLINETPEPVKEPDWEEQYERMTRPLRKPYEYNDKR